MLFSCKSRRKPDRIFQIMADSDVFPTSMPRQIIHLLGSWRIPEYNFAGAHPHSELHVRRESSHAGVPIGIRSELSRYPKHDASRGYQRVSFPLYLVIVRMTRPTRSTLGHVNRSLEAL